MENIEEVSKKINNKTNKEFYESNLLKLNSNKSKRILKWKCILSFKETISMIAEWYKNFYDLCKLIRTTDKIKTFEPNLFFDINMEIKAKIKAMKEYKSE